MGYAKPKQTAHGIHQRLRARAFIIAAAAAATGEEEEEGPRTSPIEEEQKEHDKEEVEQRRRQQSRSSHSWNSNQNDHAFLRSRLRRRSSSSSSSSSSSRKLEEEEDKDPDVLRVAAPNKLSSLAAAALRRRRADPKQTICFVSIDAGMGSDALNRRVLELLRQELAAKTGSRDNNNDNSSRDNNDHDNDDVVSLCHLENLSISGQHTHSAPAGFLQYALFQVTSLGFSRAVFDAYAAGIAAALVAAHDNLRIGKMTVASGELYNASVNRSPTSYMLNPESERCEYAAQGDTDKTMVQLNFWTIKDNNGNDNDNNNGNNDNGNGNGNGNWSSSQSDLDLAAVNNSGRGGGSGGNSSSSFDSSIPTFPNQLPPMPPAKQQQQEQHDLVGILNWFAVHGTSMNNTNQLLSGDNKGYASYLTERRFNGNDTVTGTNGTFVAAFASTNLGDVSPNTAGAVCMDTGLPCDRITSTCGGYTEQCIATGPGRTMFESTEIIGRKQYEMAVQLIDKDSNSAYLSGPVSYRHSFVDMSKVNVTLSDRKTVSTCSAALGYSFAAGTTDGPGDFDFTQGHNDSASTNPFWNMIGGFVSVPTAAEAACQAPKPILLNTGSAKVPYDWDPNTVPISIFQLGTSFYILNVPAEFTTMAGRRLRKAVQRVLVRHQKQKQEQEQQQRALGTATTTTAAAAAADGQSSSTATDHPPVVVVIAGLANSYTHYVTTEEEYGAQRYEGASTLYGPHTLAAYVQEFERLAHDLVASDSRQSQSLSQRQQQQTTQPQPPPPPPPPDLLSRQISLLPAPPVDAVAVGRRFGSVVVDVDQDKCTIRGDGGAPGSDGQTKTTASTTNNATATATPTTTTAVKVTFRSANPRNDVRRGAGKTFLTVDRLQNGTPDTWKTVYVDGDWCTKFYWREGMNILNVFMISYAEIHWDIPAETEPGTYRICHEGVRKTFWGAVVETALQYRDGGASSSSSFATALLWNNNGIRSAGWNAIVQTWELLQGVSVTVRQWVFENLVHPFRYKEFRGCSKTFVVVHHARSSVKKLNI